MHRRVIKSSVFVLVIAVIVVAFVSLYPVMDCGDHGCPNAAHSALGAAATVCVAGVLSAVRSSVNRTDEGNVTLRFASDAMSSQITASSLFRPPKF